MLARLRTGNQAGTLAIEHELGILLHKSLLKVGKGSTDVACCRLKHSLYEGPQLQVRCILALQGKKERYLIDHASYLRNRE